MFMNFENTFSFWGWGWGRGNKVLGYTVTLRIFTTFHNVLWRKYRLLCIVSSQPPAGFIHPHGWKSIATTTSTYRNKERSKVWYSVRIWHMYHLMQTKPRQAWDTGVQIEESIYGNVRLRYSKVQGNNGFTLL